MKILLACAGGMSTSILMKKMEKYCAEKGEELVIAAIGKGEVETEWHKYDCVLIGPQISFALDEIKECVGIPIAKIPPADYGMGNAANVMKLAHSLVDGK